jgi:hypothetical protein
MTRDASFQTADRDSFEEMVKPDRYSSRSPAFDQWISATANHYWDPGDKAYIDFDTPFDQKNEMILPPELIPELNCAVKDRLDEGQQIAFVNESTRFMVSSLLHGEQGALSLSASLCSILVDPGTQEFATNQVREEARHVRAFTGYIQSRFGSPLAAGSTLENILKGVVTAPEIYKKFVGMQLLVEGFAMGACTVLYTKANDPVLRRLAQLVMTDESFHHKFGQVWADTTVPALSEQEHAVIEGWAAQTFQMLFMNLMTAEQRRAIYPRFGLEWEWVFGAIREALTDARKRELMKESSNMFRVVIKTLHRAGIITDRTRPMYAAWVDMSALAKESDEMVGDAIAADGMKFLQDINSNRAPRHLRPAKS